MEPRIRYTRTPDGIAIAYCEAGQGVPLIHTPWLPWSHAQLEWRNSEMGRWYESLTGNHRVIRYDNRGTGMSDQQTRDFSIEAQVADLEAVVNSLGFDRVDLLGAYTSGPAALLYAALHPERVAHLVLWCTFARGRDYAQTPAVASIRGLIDNWEIYTETGAHAFVGWAAGDAAHEVAQLMRQAATPEIAKAFFGALAGVDVLDAIGGLRVPTLVLHPTSLQLVDIELARQLASTIPEARLVLIEGNSLSPIRDDLVRLDSVIEDFLAEASEVQAAVTPAAAPVDGVKPYPDRLTAREIEVLVRLAAGQSNREIAEELVLSVRTVERHVANIYAKTNVSGRAQATAYTLGHNLA